MDFLCCFDRHHLGSFDGVIWHFCGGVELMSAEHFGGKYSPDPTSTPPGSAPANPFRNRRAERPDWRSTLLFYVPLPLLFSGLGEVRRGNATGMIGEIGALALLLLAAWLLRDGLKAQAAYAARKIARPPAIPRKIFASVLTGCGVALAAWIGWGQGPTTGIIMGLVAATAHALTFGLDPLSKKGLEGFDEFEADRVAKAIEMGETYLTQTLDAAKRIGDRTIEGRVERMCASAREVFRAVEQDPRDLTRSRKFLSVYLMGARDATVKFADIYGRSRNAAARTAYEALLTDLETSFNAQRETLLIADRTDLDIEVEVLRERLQQEGVLAR